MWYLPGSNWKADTGIPISLDPIRVFQLFGPRWLWAQSEREWQVHNLITKPKQSCHLTSVRRTNTDQPAQPMLVCWKAHAAL